jgi:hypothetical protein
MANRTADDLIRMVDMFLRTHPGARAELGTRLRYLDDRFTAPWCVDWTAAMGAWINRVIVTKGNQHPANAYLDFARGVADGPTIWQQHNFILIGPRGYIWGDPRQIQLSQVDNAAVDPVILLFDAWRELLPIAYRPIPWTSQPRRTPTSLGPLPGPLEVEDDMFWYANRLGDARFTDAQLGLGNELR